MNRMEDETGALLARLRAYCFPGGEEAARQVQAVKTTQRGQFRSSPNARWTPFTAKETVESRRSGFRWEARFGGVSAIVVTDAYEDRRGRLTVKAGGVLPIRKEQGPDYDRGELQRYLASVMFCPPMLLNHPSLEWTAAGPASLRVRDRADSTGATVDLEVNAEGCPVACHAERPMTLGKRVVLTPWSGVGSEFREWEGLRVASRLEVSWHLPEGPFIYFRAEVTSFEVVR